MDSELIVLSSAIKSDIGFEQVTAALKEEHFSDPEFRRFFALISRFKSPPDLYTIATQNGLSAQTTALIDGSLNYIEGALEHHIGIVREAYKKHRLIEAGKYILKNQKNQSSTELQEHLFQTLGDNLEMDDRPSRHLSEVWEEFRDGKDYLDDLEEICERYESGTAVLDGLPTMYPLLDEMIGCLHNSSYIIIGARTHVGKTSFALSIALNILDKDPNTPIHFCSLEMPANRLLQRIIAQRCCVNVKDLARGSISREERSRVLHVADQVKDYNLIFEDTFSISISALRARIKAVKEKHGTKIVFVDYLTKIRGDLSFNNKHLEIDSVSKGLQRLASELKIPIVALAQFNRSSGQMGKAPQLSDFRESGSIEEDADLCLLLHKPDLYDPNIKPGMLECHIAKNRIMLELGKLDYKYESGRLVELKPLSELKPEFEEEINENFKHFS